MQKELQESAPVPLPNILGYSADLPEVQAGEDDQAHLNMVYRDEMIANYDKYWDLEYNPGSEIGSGMSGTVYAFEEDGKMYAAKFADFDDRLIEAFSRAEGISNIPHLLAINPEKSIAVMDLMPGERTDKMYLEDKVSIPDEHISSLVKTVLIMNSKGLVVDFKEGNNILYDNASGFSIVDYGLASRQLEDEEVAEQVLDLVGIFTASKVDQDTLNDFHYKKGQMAIEVGLINRFLNILENEFPQVVQIATRLQGRLNADHSGNAEGLVYDVYALPYGEPFDSFKDRIIKLGLEGHKPDPSSEQYIEALRLRYG